MRQVPVTFTRRFDCLDAAGRETWVEVALRDGELAVGSPAVGFSFGPHQIKEAEGFYSAFGLGLKLLRERREELALELGLDMLSRGGGQPAKRKGKRRGPRL